MVGRRRKTGDHEMSVRRFYLGVILLAGTSLAAASIANFKAKFLYNPSTSAPVGFYKIDDKPFFRTGDFIAAKLPIDAELLAYERRYLPKDTPVLKTVLAVIGDEICVASTIVSINGEPVAGIQSEDALGRPMPISEGCYILQPREYFLLSTDIENSFDSRYFGPVFEDHILGVATPLFIFSKEN